MNSASDTIAAIATASGRAGVGIIRISGPDARPISATLAGPMPAPRMAALRRFQRADATPIDEGLLLYFPAPHSFTGEDVVEIQAHGSPIALGEILEALCKAGARLARPGEFSERAFLNGRIDLAQAEAVADLIDASSRQAARAAVRSLQGEFSQRINAAVESLIALRVLLEAALDFADEEIPAAAPRAVDERLKVIAEELSQVQKSAAQGRRLREGLRVAIAGKPNVGKSTLLNRLAGTDAAIVSPQAGTTRDVLREHIVIGGLPLILIDTAGLRDTDDAIEREGIRRAQAEIESAELLLWIVDDRDESLETRSPDPQPNTAISAQARQSLIVRNKCDLSANTPGVVVDQQGARMIRVCAASGAGCDILIAAIQQAAGLDNNSEQVYSARARHLEALDLALVRVQAAQTLAQQHFDAVLIAEELRLAQHALEAITGKFTSEDLLGRIFGSFCLGK